MSNASSKPKILQVLPAEGWIVFLWGKDGKAYWEPVACFALTEQKGEDDVYPLIVSRGYAWLTFAFEDDRLDKDAEPESVQLNHWSGNHSDFYGDLSEADQKRLRLYVESFASYAGNSNVGA